MSQNPMAESSETWQVERTWSYDDGEWFHISDRNGDLVAHCIERKYADAIIRDHEQARLTDSYATTIKLLTDENLNVFIPRIEELERLARRYAEAQSMLLDTPWVKEARHDHGKANRDYQPNCQTCQWVNKLEALINPVTEDAALSIPEQQDTTEETA